MAPPVGLEYPFPHRVAEIGEEECERMRQYLIGTLGADPYYGQEPGPEHRYQLAHHLDVMRAVLVSRLTQSRLLGSRRFGGARDIRPDGADPDFISQAFRGDCFPEGR
ncbi:uncharacterized protein A4U43_C07F8070 [Asparagus officinalis]|uniref:Uncharacterized protein n=1 Tax=Asparagus officinalis TaxID=4686 RepID=A0A5P1EDJ9_ASPOF|nr:uncharacterized protein A4U43_C07F8070 [Asparagus officinalis]